MSLLSMAWRDLLYLHWPVPPESLRPAVPEAFSLDTCGGRAYLGVVALGMESVRPRGAPPALGRSFAEVNLRTYVTHDGDPGVYFFSLDAADRAGVALARGAFGLPYYRAEARLARADDRSDGPGRAGSGGTDRADGDPDRADEGSGRAEGGTDRAGDAPGAGAGGDGGDRSGDGDGDWRRVRSRRTHPGAAPARLVADYRPAGDPSPTDPGSLAHFLVERYRFYLVRGGRPLVGRVDHRPFRVAPATVDLRSATLAAAAGLDRPDGSPHALCAGWRPVPVTAGGLRPVAGDATGTEPAPADVRRTDIPDRAR